MSEELKACPFCGHSAVVEEDCGGGYGETFWAVCDSDDCYGRAGCSGTEEAARAAWNRRTPDWRALAQEAGSAARAYLDRPPPLTNRDWEVGHNALNRLEAAIAALKAAGVEI